MNTRWPPVIALVCAGVVLLACGGGASTKARPSSAPLTLQQYFDRVQALDATSSQRFASLGKQLGQNLPEDQALKVLREAIPEQVAILKDLRDGLEQLQPPAEAQSVHAEALAALRAFIDFSQKTAGQAAKATSFSDATKLLNSDEAHAATKRLNDSCLALVKAAADHWITIKLDCGQ